MTRASDLARLIGAGATINDGTTITTADNTAQLELVSTDADSGIGPHQVFYRNSSSPADDDLLCELDFRGRNDNSQDVNYATVNVKANDVSDGTEDGEYILQVMTAGSVDTTMHIKPAEIVFNEDSIDRDFRVESNGQANMLLVDGGNDTVSFQPNSGTLTIKAGSGDATNNVRLEAGGTTSTYLEYRGYLGHQFYVDTTERMRISSNGRVLVGATSDTGFRIVSTASGTEGCLDCVSSSTNGYYALRIDMHANNNYAQLFRQGGSVVGTILTSSGSTSYNTSSDYRLKENVTYEFDATSRLKQLKPCRFNFKIDADKTKDGFLAHEVQTIVPEAVSGEKDAVDADGNIDPQGIDQSKLVPLLVKTIQELEARITALESK